MFFTILCFFDIPGFEFPGFQQFPDTPIGKIEKLMAFQKYWDAYEAAGKLIGDNYKNADAKAIRLRAECALNMAMSQESKKESSVVINNKYADLDEKHLCYQIRARANLQLGLFNEALEDAKSSRNERTQRDINIIISKYNDYKNFFNAGKLEDAGRCLDRVLDVAVNAYELKLNRSHIAWELKDYERFGEVAKDLPAQYPDDVSLMYRLGVVSTCNAKLDDASKHFASALKFKGAPKEYRIAKSRVREMSKTYIAAKKALNAGNISDVEKPLAKLYDLAYEYCSGQSELVMNLNLIRLQIVRKTSDKNATLHFLNEAIANFSNCAEFEIERGEILIEDGDYDAAIYDFQSALRKRPNNKRANDGLNKAQQKKRELTMVDYYKILGVPRDATQSEIKTAFRKATLKWHPDRHRGVEEKKDAEQMMKKINVAFDILSDPQKKQMYDNGIDPDNPQVPNGPGMDFQDLSDLFNNVESFFTQGGTGKKFHFTAGGAEGFQFIFQ